MKQSGASAILSCTGTVSVTTNWSTGAETKQDNEITVIADHVIAAEARARVDAIHANVLAKQSLTQRNQA